jgi:hypothetical protein
MGNRTASRFFAKIFAIRRRLLVDVTAPSCMLWSFIYWSSGASAETWQTHLAGHEVVEQELEQRLQRRSPRNRSASSGHRSVHPASVA